MTALVTKHLPLVVGAPDGVKTLRELVLELAVCGRLLAQDASDEPADLLIDRIEVLKASQISSGAVKRQKATTQPTVQPTHAIPESWRFVQLGDVVEIVRGITFPASEKSKEPSPGRIACLRTANVQSQIEWDDLLYIDESFVSREDQFLQPNDIVMSMANSRELVGKVALVGGEPLQRSTFGGFLGVLRPYLIEPRFIMALLRTPSARSALIDSASQTTNIANISLGKLRPLMVALPPLAEQHRIVAKVDELMALCDRLEADQADAEAAHAQLVQALLDSLTQATDAAYFRASWQRLSEHVHTLFTTEASIDALKQTLLQLGTKGKLVEYAGGDEEVTELFSKLVSSKEELVKAKLYQKSAELKPKQYDLGLPRHWLHIQIGSVCPSIVPNRDKPKSFNGDIPWVTLPSFPEDGWLLDESKVELGLTATEVNDSAARVIPAGSVLMSCVGRFGLVAINKVPVVANQQVHAYVVLPGLLPDYLAIAVKASIDQLERAATSTTIAYLNKANCESIEIGLPPTEEQHLIVAKVNELMALCDQLKAGLAESRQLHGQLVTALVEQAVA